MCRVPKRQNRISPAVYTAKPWKCDTCKDELHSTASIKSNGEVMEDKISILEAVKSMKSEHTVTMENK